VGGRVSLSDAATARGISLPDLEAELEGVAARSLPASRPEATHDIIALIETLYHATHRREFPEIIKLARRVKALHNAHIAVPHGLADLVQRMSDELGDHMNKEEQVLFSLMRAGGHPAIGQPIAVMLAGHDDHGARLRELERLATDFTVPDDACPTWRALYVGARKLTDDLMEHIHIENNVLFPRFTDWPSSCGSAVSALVTTFLLPAIRRSYPARQRFAGFHAMEARFAWKARFTTVTAGASRFHMAWRL
jgi:regulator of cell morphogenesis and NO signaling